MCANLAGSPVNWSNCISAFVMLIGGSVLALIIMTIEHGTKKLFQRKSIGMDENN